MAFATADDVAARLGREFSAQETTQAEALLDLIALAIADACDQEEAWIETVAPTPPALKVVSVQVAARALANPDEAAVLLERLGEWQSQATFNRDSVGLDLTEDEVLRVRRAVFGSNAASVRLPSLVDDLTGSDGS